MAITPVFCCGFEEGLATTATGHWILNNATIQSVTKRTGTYALKCNPSNAIHNACYTLPSSANIAVARVYVYFVALPDADSRMATFLQATNLLGAWFKVSDSKIYAGYEGSFGGTGISVTTGQWYCIDIRIDIHANPWLIDVQVDGVACGQLSLAFSANTVTAFYVGEVSNRTGEWYFDDVILSVTTGDYPIGAGKVLAFMPTSDGTHSFTLNDFLYNASGGSIAVAATDVHTYLDELPLAGGGDFINQAVTRTTGYVEVCFADTDEASPPRGVEVMICNHQTYAGTGTSTFKLYDNAGSTEDTVLARTGIGSSDLQYVRKHYTARPAALGAWTVATFNDLRFRFGYSSDATPDQYFDGVIIEAEFPPAGGAVGDTIQSVFNIRYALGDTVQPVFNIRYALSDTVQAKFNILTTVYDTLQTIFNVKTFIGKSGQELWNVRYALGDTVQPVFNVRYALSDTVQSIWNVNTTVFDTIQSIFNVRTYIGDSVQSIFNIRYLIGDIVQPIFNVRQVIGDASQHMFNVRGAVGDSVQVVFNTLELLGKTSQTIWNVYTIIGDTVQSIFNVLTFIGDEVQTPFNVRYALGKEDQHIWNVTSLVNKSNQDIWNVRQTLGDIIQSIFNVRTLAGKENELTWNVNQNIYKDNAPIWNVLTTLNKDGQYIWYVLTSANKDSAYLWKIRSKVGEGGQFIWKIEIPPIQFGIADLNVYSSVVAKEIRKVIDKEFHSGQHTGFAVISDTNVEE